MNFKQATDALLESVTLQDLADAMGISLQAVRQARSSEGSGSHRPPPSDWERAVAKLASRRGARLQRLAFELSKPAKG